MAAFYTDSVGVLAGLRNSAAQEQQFPIPNDALYVIRFDESTNAGLIADYGQNSNAFGVQGGTLVKNDVEATINPPSTYYEALQELPGLLVKLDNNDPFTTAELKAALRLLFRATSLD